MAAQFLMTDPGHYCVGYEINPWMRPGVWRADPVGLGQAARAAWSGLKAALEARGAVVRIIPGLPGQPDMVFPANAAVVLDRKALVARFRHPERAGEEAGFVAAFEQMKAAGLIDHVAQIEVTQEGAGDCIWDAGRSLFWAGEGPRSSPKAAAVIERHFDREVVRLALASRRYYHLDTCFRPLPGGEILYHPPAFTPQALGRLRARVPAHLLVEAGAGDAERFSVNAVEVERTLIMATPTDSLRARLNSLGYAVVGLDLSPFLLSGGGAFCMTLRLDLESTAAPISLSA